MAVVTPFLFAIRGEQGVGPQLTPTFEPDLLESLREISFDERLDPYLEPVPFESALQEPLAGVPLLAEQRVEELLSTVEQSPPEWMAATGRWWDFIRTDTGEYAIFPGDDSPVFRVRVALLMPVGPVVRLRRLETKLEVVVVDEASGALLEQSGPEPEVLDEPCTYDVDGVEEGAPYVGSCGNVSCSGGCSPLVYVTPDDGIYRLVGCNC